MFKKGLSARKFLMMCPIVALGLCFQNFTELEVPEFFGDPSAQPVRATSVEGAAEELLRREMPELVRIEDRLKNTFQFQWANASMGNKTSAGPPQNLAEVHLQLLESPTSSRSEADRVRVSLVNDRFRLDVSSLAIACDYSPVQDVVSVRSTASASNQIVFEHSGRDQLSRVNWQLSW